MSKLEKAPSSIGFNSAAFTVDELAAYFRISRASVWRLLRDGRIARVRIGGRTVIRRIDADAFLARSAVVA